MFTFVLTTYFCIGFYFLFNWLSFFVKNPSSNVLDRFLSIIVLIVAVNLWFLTPTINLINKFQSKRKLNNMEA